MVNTLAGSYNASEIVVMHNIQLPELDKNRNVDQQKELVFESKTCKYDVILGADFLTKTGIDVKYSTRTIKWFENELPLRDPYSLKTRIPWPWLKYLKFSKKLNYTAWTGMIQHAMQSKY